MLWIGNTYIYKKDRISNYEAYFICNINICTYMARKIVEVNFQYKSTSERK